MPGGITISTCDPGGELRPITSAELGRGLRLLADELAGWWPALLGEGAEADFGLAFRRAVLLAAACRVEARP